MDPFLCFTIALESAAVKSRFHRFDGARFLNDVGREVSAFLGKSSRELTFNCPSNTVILPDIGFIFIRRGVLMVAQYLEEDVALGPLASPAAAPHVRVPSAEGDEWGHGYDPVEDELYILFNEGDAFLLDVHSLADDANPTSRTLVVEGMMQFAGGRSICRGDTAFVAGRMYLPCSVEAFRDEPPWLVCLDARDRSMGTIQAQMICQLSDSSSNRPISLVCEAERVNDCVICIAYYNSDEEWAFRKLLVAHRGSKVSAVSLSSWTIRRPHDCRVMEYQLLRKNLLLLCIVGDSHHAYFYSLCDERGRELGARRGQLSGLEPQQTLISDDGTIYIRSGFTGTIHDPVDCVHAFFTQARYFMHTEIPNWFFDNKELHVEPVDR
ncbi:hypothetical protein FOZ63_026845 [Perkinsus olseni]|uniref:Uncharacterized protein n=1 Tax=Perkinsus olseni TaxID=32597 RepID=A0A7J6Q2N6_PEROL|nr:hypothetical protein FOZ63_026845 [Perkinsus olseni]